MVIGKKMKQFFPSRKYAKSVYIHFIFTGYYTHVSTLADVQENVMEYLHVLSRPMVINHDHDIIWTEAYMDTVVSKKMIPIRKTPENYNTKSAKFTFHKFPILIFQRFIIHFKAFQCDFFFFFVLFVPNVC